MFRPSGAEMNPAIVALAVAQGQVQAVGVLLTPSEFFFQLRQYTLQGKQQPLRLFDVLKEVHLLPEHMRRVPGLDRVRACALDFLKVAQGVRR